MSYKLPCIITKDLSQHLATNIFRMWRTGLLRVFVNNLSPHLDLHCLTKMIFGKIQKKICSDFSYRYLSAFNIQGILGIIGTLIK